jgi:hypothetical protein
MDRLLPPHSSERRGVERRVGLVIEFARQHPEQYDPEFEKGFHGWVEELDPPATT